MPGTKTPPPSGEAISAAGQAADTDSTGAMAFVELLETLGYRDGEFVAVCHEPVGGRFCAAVMSAADAPGYVVERFGNGVAADVWFSVNPTAGPARVGGTRGTSEHVTRLAALYADLDVKPGACPDLATAERVIDELSAVLGQRPSSLVYSGGGIHPYWVVDDGEIGESFTTADAVSILGRFGRLVAVVAEHHGGAVDTVFDPARVLRVPGTLNHKSVPVPVTARGDTGGPLSVTEIDERLSEHGIDRQPDDAVSTDLLSDPTGWQFAAQTCAYVAKWIDGIATDGPQAGKGRNPWACSQAVRLCCAWRLGCITEADLKRALVQLEARVSVLLATTANRRALRRYEMRDICKLGRLRAAQKTDDQARAELGNHSHSAGGTAEDFWGTGTVNGSRVNGAMPETVPVLTSTVAAAPPSGAVDGAAFILDQPDTIPALWGRGSDVLWAAGEALMIAGGMGLGKTTLAGQIVRALLVGGDVLGLPVTGSGESVLYLAMDRPRQIARSMRRQFGESHRDALRERVKVRPGPPPSDLAKHPGLLAQMADYYGCGVVFVDSLKDAALGLSDDEVGAGYNRARQLLLSTGREVVELHHVVKRGQQGGSATGAADIYGSTWLTAGCGSVILLTGEPGDPIVGFRHVKQPADEVGPYRLLHDQTAGLLTVDHLVDLVALVKVSGVDGLTAKSAASAMFETAKPTRAEIQKAHRKLDHLVETGALTSMGGGKGQGKTTVWFIA